MPQDSYPSRLLSKVGLGNDLGKTSLRGAIPQRDLDVLVLRFAEGHDVCDETLMFPFCGIRTARCRRRDVNGPVPRLFCLAPVLLSVAFPSKQCFPNGTALNSISFLELDPPLYRNTPSFTVQYRVHE
jgi:hypothetical protein